MADFVPTSTVYFFRRTSVDPQNQPYFTSESEKLSWYMSNHSFKIFQEQSYQRFERWIRVQAKAAEMREYDMMAFQNDPADRWIFCRVVEVEFVNPNTSQITFEVDSMQTYIDVIEFKQCWVEREMQSNDWSGTKPNFVNLMPEGLEVGQTLDRTLINTTSDQEQYGLVVLSAYDASAEPNYDIKNDGNFIYGLNIIRQDQTGLGIMLGLYQIKGRLDGIAGIWMVPKNWVNYTSKEYVTSLGEYIAGYKPHNAKCWCGEFCTLSISNRQGVSIDLPVEYATDSNFSSRFVAEGGFLGGGGGICMYPKTYMGGQVTANACKDYGVVLPLGVQTCYVSNAFANWVAQNRGGLLVDATRNILSFATGAGMAIGGLYTGNVGMAAQGAKETSGALYNSINTMTSLMAKASNPAGLHGQVDAGALMINMNTWGLTVSLRTPCADVIKSIDQFFDVYGYRTCEAKVPNVNTRPYWNYVKCAPAVVKGPFTARDKANIEATLNAGVTFWHVTNGAVIGDYSLDNRE